MLRRARFLLGMIDHRAHRRHQHRARIGPRGLDRVECAALDQRLDRATIHRALVDATAEVDEARERAAGFANRLAKRLARRVTRWGGRTRLDDRLDRRTAGAFDRAEAEANRLRVDRNESILRGVDIGWQKRDAVGNRVLVELTHLVGIVHRRRQVRGHERARMVDLKIRGLISDPCVRGGVRLVEAVAGELLHLVEELARTLLLHPALDGALDEDVALHRHLFGLLFAHGATQQVGAAETVAGDHLRDLHHLLLVAHDAVRFRKDRLEPRVQIFDALAAMLPCDVGRNQLHWSRPIHCVQRNQVLETRRLRLHAHVAHSARFELEDRIGTAFGENLVRRRIVERELVEIER